MDSTYKSIIILLSIIQVSMQYEYIATIIDEFELNNLHLIGSSNEIDLPLMKPLFAKGFFMHISSHIDQPLQMKSNTASAIVFLSYHQDVTENFHLELPENPYFNLILISHGHQFEELLNAIAMQTKIHQKILIFKKDSQEIYEAYTVNNFDIRKKLGKIDVITNQFQWEVSVNQNFIKRRSNFHGLVLKGVVQFSGLDMNANASYLVNAPYFPNNETYEVTRFTYGLFKDILDIMQESLNFTTILYKRKEEVWGSIYPQANGSFTGTGLTGDIFFGNADIAVAPLNFVIDRAIHINFLPPIKPYFSAIYIPMTDHEVIDLDTYVRPFTSILWTIVILTGIILTMMKLLFLHMNNNMNLFGFDYIWTSFTGFFGGRPNVTPIDSKFYYNSAIFVTLLCGTVIWISYRAGLTSELSVISKSYPFTDMMSFSKTNWRMLTGAVDSTPAALFLNSTKDSSFGQVFEKNMDSNSFNGNYTLQIELALSNSKYAYFYSCGTLRNTEAYENCQIEEVWKYRMGSYSIPLTKGLPYDIFMRQIIFEITERGQLYQLQKKSEISKPDCGELYRSKNPLSWRKIMTVFVIVIIGISMALIILIIEKKYHHNHHGNFKFDSPKCLSNREINKIKLQSTLKKINSSLNDDTLIERKMMKAFYQEVEKYNSLLY